MFNVEHRIKFSHVITCETHAVKHIQFSHEEIWLCYYMWNICNKNCLSIPLLFKVLYVSSPTWISLDGWGCEYLLFFSFSRLLSRNTDSLPWFTVLFYFSHQRTHFIFAVTHLTSIEPGSRATYLFIWKEDGSWPSES